MELNEFLKAIQEAKLYKNMIFANMDSEERISFMVREMNKVAETFPQMVEYFDPDDYNCDNIDDPEKQ